MGSVEAFVLELAVKQLGLRREVQKGQEQCLVTSLFSFCNQFLDVIGMGFVLASVVAAQMRGDEFFMVIDVEMAGIDFQGEFLRGIKRRHGVTIGIKGNPAAAIGVGRTDDRAEKWRDSLARDPWVAESTHILDDMVGATLAK